MTLDDCEIVRAYDNHYFGTKHGIRWKTYGANKSEIEKFTTTVMQNNPTIVFIDYHLEVDGQKYTTGDKIARQLRNIGYKNRIILRSANLVKSEFEFIDKATENLLEIVTSKDSNRLATTNAQPPLNHFFVSEMRKRVDLLSKNPSSYITILHKMKGSAGVFASTGCVEVAKLRDHISELYAACKAGRVLEEKDIDDLHTLIDAFAFKEAC